MAERIVICDLQMEEQFFKFFFCIPHKCSVCPPFVTWQTSSRYSTSAHTCFSMWTSISQMAAMIRLRSSGRSCDRGGRKTNSLTYLHKKNPPGIKLGKIGDQRIRPWCAVAGMDGNGLSAAGHLPCHVGRTHTALMRYKKTWRVSLSICRSHVTILSVTQVCRFY